MHPSRATKYYQPAAMFFTDDVQTDLERMKRHGAVFTMPSTAVTTSKIATRI